MLTESAEQRAVVEWWRLYAPTRGIDARLLIAVPNGGHLAGDARQRAIQMRRLKGEGLQPGTPDLFLAWPKLDKQGTRAAYSADRIIFHGLFVEMKSTSGTLQPEQTVMIETLRRAGYNVVVSYGADEAMRAIKYYIGA